MNIEQFIDYQTKLYDRIAKMCVVVAKEKPKSPEDWIKFIKENVTRVKDGYRVKYYLNYNNRKPVIKLVKGTEDLGNFEEKIRSEITTVDIADIVKQKNQAELNKQYLKNKINV